MYILFSSIKKLFVFTNTSSPMPSPPGVMGIIFDIVARELLIKTLIILISNSKKYQIGFLDEDSKYEVSDDSDLFLKMSLFELIIHVMFLFFLI